MSLQIQEFDFGSQGKPVLLSGETLFDDILYSASAWPDWRDDRACFQCGRADDPGEYASNYRVHIARVSGQPSVANSSIRRYFRLASNARGRNR